MIDESNVVSFPKEGRPAIRKELHNVAAEKKARCRHETCTISRYEPVIACDKCGAVVDPYEWLRKNIEHFGMAIKNGAEMQRDDLQREAKELTNLVRQLRGEFKDEMEKKRFQSQVVIKPPKRAKLVERV